LTAQRGSPLIPALSQQVDLGIWQRLTHLVIGLIILACLLGVFFWYLPVFQQNERMRGEILVLQNQVKAEEQKQKLLDAAVRNLKDDPKTVERLAREKLGYAKPGETVIYFSPATGKP
jgi:cell division protein FtsB